MTDIPRTADITIRGRLQEKDFDTSHKICRVDKEKKADDITPPAFMLLIEELLPFQGHNLEPEEASDCNTVITGSKYKPALER